jgi:acyl-CoA reductase-like NAD-dependent aldehyde dehydrogenase
MGPLIHERAVAKCEEHVNDAVGRGANVLVGGKGLGGCFYPPTLLGDAPNDCVSGEHDENVSPADAESTLPQLLTDEETFGPVAALIKFKTESEVIVSRVRALIRSCDRVAGTAIVLQNLANASNVGLAG